MAGIRTDLSLVHAAPHLDVGNRGRIPEETAEADRLSQAPGTAGVAPGFGLVGGPIRPPGLVLGRDGHASALVTPEINGRYRLRTADDAGGRHPAPRADDASWLSFGHAYTPCPF